VNQVVVLALVMPYFYLVPWWIVRRDMRGLPPERLARCWNSASFGSAVLAFGPLCMPVHFIKAHGWLRGSVRGVLWTTGAVLLPDLVLAGIS
jgi:hypothetical protein